MTAWRRKILRLYKCRDRRYKPDVAKLALFCRTHDLRDLLLILFPART